MNKDIPPSALAILVTIYAFGIKTGSLQKSGCWMMNSDVRVPSITELDVLTQTSRKHRIRFDDGAPEPSAV